MHGNDCILRNKLIFFGIFWLIMQKTILQMTRALNSPIKSIFLAMFTVAKKKVFATKQGNIRLYRIQWYYVAQVVPKTKLEICF